MPVVNGAIAQAMTPNNQSPPVSARCIPNECQAELTARPKASVPPKLFHKSFEGLTEAQLRKLNQVLASIFANLPEH